MNKEQNDLGVAASEQAAGLSVASPQPKTASGLYTSIPNAKERPILFSAPMVRAILDGTKTQTRRIIKDATGSFWDHKAWKPEVVRGAITHWVSMDTMDSGQMFGAGSPQRVCPYGKPGDRLWVRETWQELDWPPTGPRIVYRADNDADPAKWRPSIFMPRAMSRINLEVVNVRVEQLQDISEDDAEAEGIECIDRPTGGDDYECFYRDYSQPFPNGDDGWPWFSEYRKVDSYRTLWESINGPGSWDKNPWVWVVEFRVRDSSENPSRSSGKIVADSPTGGSAPGTPKP